MQERVISQPAAFECFTLFYFRSPQKSAEKDPRIVTNNVKRSWHPCESTLLSIIQNFEIRNCCKEGQPQQG